MREIGVGLLGLGNVGAGVVKLLSDNADAIEARLGARVAVRAIGVRDVDKARLVEVDRSLLTTDPNAVIDRDDIQIVCELIGGDTDARTLSLRALRNKKHLVTANKALLALHGEEVFSTAEANGVDLYYEAAVCGGVPIIRALREGLASDKIEGFYGIVNGTSNFILSQMAKEGAAFADVLARAQEAGYAEADPTLDISGGDASHKLAILAMLCFGTPINVSDIYVEGIERLSPVDFEYAERFGYVIKPLVVGTDWRRHRRAGAPGDVATRLAAGRCAGSQERGLRAQLRVGPVDVLRRRRRHDAHGHERGVGSDRGGAQHPGRRDRRHAAAQLPEAGATQAAADERVAQPLLPALRCARSPGRARPDHDHFG